MGGFADIGAFIPEEPEPSANHPALGGVVEPGEAAQEEPVVI